MGPAPAGDGARASRPSSCTASGHLQHATWRPSGQHHTKQHASPNSTRHGQPAQCRTRVPRPPRRGRAGGPVPAPPRRAGRPHRAGIYIHAPRVYTAVEPGGMLPADSLMVWPLSEPDTPLVRAPGAAAAAAAAARSLAGVMAILIRCGHEVGVTARTASIPRSCR